jgi:pilus assembly protein CpaE
MRNPPYLAMLDRLARGGERPGHLPAAATTAVEPTRVLLVDGHQVRMLGLREQLTATALQVVGQCGFGAFAARRARETSPDLVLVAADQQASSAVMTIQALAFPGAPWTVVAIAEQHEPELLRKLMLAGARDVVLRNWSRLELQQALTSARTADLRAAEAGGVAAPQGVVVSIFGVKGGIGKTTVSTNLAVSLARETGRSVVIVDLDVPFGDDALALNVEGDPDFLGALEDAMLPEPDRLIARLVRGPEGLRVLSGTIPGDLTGLVESGPVVQLLRRLAELHDFVVVDTPPGVNELNAAALDVATMGLLVTTPELACLRRTRQCVSLLRGLGFSQDRLKLVLNRAASRTSLDEAQARSVLGSPITWRVENDHAVLACAARGQPVVISDPRSQFATNIQAIARQIAGLPSISSQSWWQRIRSRGRQPVSAVA